jgi:replicative DNA helicase/intein/homing endonuclease
MITSGTAQAGWLLGMLNEQHFYKPQTKEAFRYIKKAARKQSNIPEWDDLLHDPSLSSKTRDSLKLLKTKPKATKEKCKSVFNTLEKYRQLRAQYFGIRELANKFAGDDLLDPTKITEDISNIISHVREVNEDIKTFVTGEGNNSAKLVQQILSGSALVAIPTGFKAFDNINRGFFKGSLITLGGTTGGGKTCVSLQLASNFADNGAKVCIVSLEMKEEEVMVRNLSRYSGVALSKLIDAETMSELDKKKVRKSYAERVRTLKARGGSETIHVPQSDITIEELLYVLKGYGYDIIIIDYISLLKDAGGDDQWRKLGDVARFAKVFAKNNNCIVILLAQVNGEGIIRYSRAVEEHCVVGETLIATENGLQRIDKIFSDPQKYKVFGKDGKLHKVTNKYNNNIKPVYELTTVDGNSIEVTKKHQFLVIIDGKEVWLPLAKIKLGMVLAKSAKWKWPTKKILLPKFVTTLRTNALPMKKYPTKVDEKLARLLGYLAGDGWITKECVGFVNTEKFIIKDYVECFKHVFGETPYVKSRFAKNKNGELGKETYVVAFYRKSICDFMKNTIGLYGNSHEKCVPDCIMQSPKNIVKNFISALYECDGNISKNTILYATTSKMMATQIHLLLINFGLHGSIRKVYGKKDTHRTQYHLKLGGGKQIDKFIKEIDFITKFNEYEPKWTKDSSMNWLGQNRLTVESIKYVGKRQVYDITVPASSHYIAGGKVVHNSNNAWYFVRDQKSIDSKILYFIQKKARNQQMFPFEMEEDFAHMTVKDLDDVKRQEVEKRKAEKKEEKATTIKTNGSYKGKDSKSSEPKFKRKVIEDEDSYFDDVA